MMERAKPTASPRSLLAAAVDTPGLYLDAPADIDPYTIDWTRKFRGTTPLVVRPKTTDELARVLFACHRYGIKVVPQGGNTGMVGGSTPRQGEVVISLSRMGAIEDYDDASGTIQVQAGVVLQTLHEHLDAHGMVFPVDLGGRGSCQIGGMIATNAGGLKVVRYGHMREQVRGLEVVLADGTVVSNLNKLKKNNTGIDLKHLFIGSEGILGIVTRAVLQASPRPRAVRTALAALGRLDDLPALYIAVRRSFPGLSSLECVVRDAIDFLRAVEPSIGEPFGQKYPAYVLIEEEGEPGEGARASWHERLMALIEDGAVLDIVIAESEAQARALWSYRERPTEAIGKVGLTHKYDVSVPQGAIPGFLAEVAALAKTRPGLRPLFYGHLGDGNMHINMVQRPELPVAQFHAEEPALSAAIYQLVAGYRGSVSAEHGIGVMKRAYLHHSRTAEEIALMRSLKVALDPAGILNPGVILP
jgi:FAD/FMN-containing dehydrogenase